MILKMQQKVGIEIGSIHSRAKFIDELFSATVEPTLIQPTFVVDYPLELSPLAKNIVQKKVLLKDLKDTF